MRLREGKVIDGTASYDSISFNDLWARVAPRVLMGLHSIACARLANGLPLLLIAWFPDLKTGAGSGRSPGSFLVTCYRRAAGRARRIGR